MNIGIDYYEFIQLTSKNNIKYIYNWEIHIYYIIYKVLWHAY